MLSPSKYPIVALCGPSGVGKSTLKARIREHGDLEFAEPVVATTRDKRPDDDRSRMAGISDDVFDLLINKGEIILPHRPFREINSPRYGFMRDSFVDDSPVLTEVHSSILPNFRAHFEGRPIIIFGMLAARNTLSVNINARQADACTITDTALRLMMGQTEEEEVHAAHIAGIINHVVSCEPEHRQSTQNFIVDSIRTYVQKVA